MRSIVITDNRTSEPLKLEYDAEMREFFINGLGVVRRAQLEDSDNEYVFAERGSVASESFHISAVVVQELLQPIQ